MKKFKFSYIALAMITVFALVANAAPVSSDQALSFARSWLAVNGETFGKTGESVSSSPVYDDDGITILYYIVTTSANGALIIAPDTSISPVVAVVENFDGAFPVGHPLPSILKSDMRNRLRILGLLPSAKRTGGVPMFGAAAPAALPNDVASSVNESKSAWSRYGVATPGFANFKMDVLVDGDRSPYVRRIVDGFESGGRYTHWNQGKVGGYDCYNKFTPKSPGAKNNAVCGCVATAGSAILQFFHCTNDPGVVANKCTLNGESGVYKTIAGAPDWDSLPAKTYGGLDISRDVINDDDRTVLGKVAYNMGVLVGMNWDSDGPDSESGAALGALAGAFKAYGFKTARGVSFSSLKSMDNDKKAFREQFAKAVYAQNWCGAPVALGIHQEGASSGHAVVAVGYARDPDGDEFCRVFMGWAGSADAWYQFPDVESYNEVVDCVTMIGYDDDAVIPVYGETNVPGVELELPGWKIDGENAKVAVSDLGFFGIRVPPTITETKIVYAPRNKEADFSPFDGEVAGSELTASAASLKDVVPDETVFSIVDMSVKYTIDSARAVALRDNKAVLMVSGTPGEERSSALMNYIYELDSTCDLSNKFVLVYSNYLSSDPRNPDGNPSIGVFNPNQGSSEGRWAYENGRMAYNNFIEGENATDGTPVYVFSADNIEPMKAIVDSVLADGYLAYARATSNTKVTVTGVDYDSFTNAAFEVATVFPTYGVYEGAYTNGEIVTFTAPGIYTNNEEGVAYECIGWTTSDFFQVPEGILILGGGTPSLERGEYNEGNEAKIQLFGGEEVKLTWIWRADIYRVTACATLRSGAVNVSESWVRAGERITLETQSAIDGYGFNFWDIRTEDDFEYEDYYDDAAIFENESAIAFTVFEPVIATANYYPYKGSASKVPQEYKLKIAVEPADLIGVVPNPKSIYGYDVELGENSYLDRYALYSIDEDGLNLSLSFDETEVEVDGGKWVLDVDGSEFEFNDDGTELGVKLNWIFVSSVVPEPPHGLVSDDGSVTNGMLNISMAGKIVTVTAEIENGYSAYRYNIAGASTLLGEYAPIDSAKLMEGSVYGVVPEGNNVPVSLKIIFDRDNVGNVQYFKVMWENAEDE